MLQFFCTEKIENELLVIAQGVGFFKGFSVTLKFEAIDKKSTKLTEIIEYYAPRAPLLSNLFKKFSNKKLNRFFLYREKTLNKDLYYREKYPVKGMKIAISGTSGLIAGELKSFFDMLGVQVFSLVRAPSNKEDEIYYDTKKHLIQSEKLEGLDCIIHLAGKPLTLNPSQLNLQEVKESRVESTKLIVQAINQCKNPPKTFMCASAIGIYDFNKNFILDESASVAENKMAQICKEWEAAANMCQTERVINLRFAPVLCPNKGILTKMLPFARKGLLPILSGGTQSMSWISIDDVLYQILHIVYCKQINGPVNLTSPNFVTQKNFTKTLCKFIKRPQIFKIHKSLLRFVLPKFTREILLCNQKVYPAKLSESGAEFAYPHIEDTFNHFF